MSSVRFAKIATGWRRKLLFPKQRRVTLSSLTTQEHMDSPWASTAAAVNAQRSLCCGWMGRWNSYGGKRRLAICSPHSRLRRDSGRKTETKENQIMKDITDQTETLWRKRITKRCGGAVFDAPGGGYSFSAVLAEERELAKQNIANEPETGLLKLSVADPTWKMSPEAIDAAQAFYTVDPNATRYTDNRGIAACPHIGQQGDTHTELANYLRRRFTGGGVEFTHDH